MAPFTFNSNRFSELERELEDYQTQRNEGKYQEDDDCNIFLGILKEACSLIRDMDGFTPDSKEIVDKVDQMLSGAISYAYNDKHIALYDFMPSFAHSDSDAFPLVDGKLSQEESPFSHGQLALVLPLFKLILGKKQTEPFIPPPGAPPLKNRGPWSESMKPHPSTTHLARFRDDVSFSTTADQPLANIIHQARCEITSSPSFFPVGLSMSANGTCLVISGRKNRTPVLQYSFPDHAAAGFPGEHDVDLGGLSDIANWTTTDEERKLIFAADTQRIKSFKWGPASGENYDDVLPTHTMHACSYNGPLAILSGGRLIRCGKGTVALWNLDALPTHGTKGKGKKRSRKMRNEGSLRDNQTSQGSPADASIKLEDPNLSVKEWHAHPSLAGTMIIGSDMSTRMYSCVAVDLEHGGKTVAKYLGHGAHLNAITTSPADSNTFVTACNDGFARVYDVRRPLPVLTLNSGIMVHPDGIPTVFTGSGSREQIKTWDIRARQPVYELSTGNNAVVDMAWDAAHNSLYAVTNCIYMDSMGNSEGYRKARVPRNQIRTDEDRCWPRTAHHGENYFGYMFDAGGHSIYRYAFKENADTAVVPAYGNATLGGSFW